MMRVRDMVKLIGIILFICMGAGLIALFRKNCKHEWEKQFDIDGECGHQIVSKCIHCDLMKRELL